LFCVADSVCIGIEWAIPSASADGVFLVAVAVTGFSTQTFTTADPTFVQHVALAIAGSDFDVGAGPVLNQGFSVVVARCGVRASKARSSITIAHSTHVLLANAGVCPIADVIAIDVRTFAARGAVGAEQVQQVVELNVSVPVDVTRAAENACPVVQCRVGAVVQRRGVGAPRVFRHIADIVVVEVCAFVTVVLTSADTAIVRVGARSVREQGGSIIVACFSVRAALTRGIVSSTHTASINHCAAPAYAQAILKKTTPVIQAGAFVVGAGGGVCAPGISVAAAHTTNVQIEATPIIHTGHGVVGA
jgi:hypothetical protein